MQRHRRRHRNPRLEPGSLNLGLGMLGALYGASTGGENAGMTALGYGFAGYLLGSVLTEGGKHSKPSALPKRRAFGGFGGGRPYQDDGMDDLY